MRVRRDQPRERLPHEIAGAFERRDELARRLARMDRALAKVGAQYSRQQGFTVVLKPDLLRAEIQR